MNLRWIVDLSEEERSELDGLISGGTLGARKLKRALTLRMSDGGWSKEKVAEALGIGTATVYRTRRRYVEEGLPDALNDRSRPGAARKLSATDEATLVALACSKAPQGRAKWTMQLLADRLVALTDLDEISSETVRRRLSEKKLKPWQRKMWCIPTVDAEFVARMEDVLALYAEPYDPRFPVVNLDETPVQLIGETRVPRPPAPGRPAQLDYEYRRHGTANLFVTFERHRCWRNVDVTKRRTSADFAEQMRALVDIHYPEAEKIHVVLDNLNTHRISNLYEHFDAEQARRIASKLEFHFTPKHASWLNMVEIEIGVLSRQCLDRRIPSINELSAEIDAWQQARNAAEEGIDWLFNIDKARHKMRRSYPRPSGKIDVDASANVVRNEDAAADPMTEPLEPKADASFAESAAVVPPAVRTMMRRCKAVFRELRVRRLRA